MRRFALLGSMALWIASAPAQAQICRFTPFNTTDQAPRAETAMTVSAGQACPIGSARRDVVVTLTRPPRNGTVTINGGTIIYRPRAGFVGRDSFETRRELMQAPPGAVLRTLTVSVNVVAPNFVDAKDERNTPRPPLASGPPRQAAPVPAAPPPAQAAATPCIPGVNFGGDGSMTQSVPMRVAAGGACGIRIQGSGITPRLDAPPRFGTVTIAGTLLIYRPMPGYRGTDAFSFSWTLPYGPGDRMSAGINVLVE